MAAPRSLSELNDDLTEEILLRVAPDKPAHLCRASLVCKPWHRVVSDPGFLRRYRVFHRRPPLLGFFYNLNFPHPVADFPGPFSRFVATTEDSPSPFSHAAAAAHVDDRYRHVFWALDCRHGRVLFKMAGSYRRLAVWDPIADDWTDLPPPTLPSLSYSYSAVVLCDVAGCDHLDCRRGRFLVVCIGLDSRSTAYACVYSSEDGAWRAPVSDGTRTRWCWRMDMKRPALIGDGIYCTVGGSSRILRYDLVARRFAVIDMPNRFGEVSLRLPGRDTVLMQNEDGSLGIAAVRASRIFVWSRRWMNDADAAAAAGWVQRRVFKLGKLLPPEYKQCFRDIVIAGFAEGVGVFVVRTNAGVFTLDVRSRRMTKVMSHSDDNYDHPSRVVPFISFFTPADRASGQVANSSQF